MVIFTGSLWIQEEGAGAAAVVHGFKSGQSLAVVNFLACKTLGIPLPMPQCGSTFTWTRLSEILFKSDPGMWPLIGGQGGSPGTTIESCLCAQDPLGCGQPLSVAAQVGVGLYRLAHGTSFVTMAHVFRISKETADKAPGRFVNAVSKLFCFCAISFPSLEKPEDWCEIMASFERCQGIPWVVGAIDGTHIPIVMPPNNNWKSYINRKSWPSIVLHGGGAGSMHDGHVLWRSLLGQNTGYPSNVNIILPYPLVVKPANQFFNYLQSSSRIVVKQAFGRLKT
ncbi:hypothetical protein VP01_1450g5 [Puccinia sorghi]|uniref:DDE Tnp4 domain-containing protein n=1 Tax=Puccinia sorghi TaxID=27349 RepID=A0A0L6VK13_9BASI|nr:hypothetical protein VP01_1450g5 [Puccinia sorghi]